MFNFWVLETHMSTLQIFGVKPFFLLLQQLYFALLEILDSFVTAPFIRVSMPSLPKNEKKYSPRREMKIPRQNKSVILHFSATEKIGTHFCGSNMQGVQKSTFCFKKPRIYVHFSAIKSVCHPIQKHSGKKKFLFIAPDILHSRLEMWAFAWLFRREKSLPDIFRFAWVHV